MHDSSPKVPPSGSATSHASPLSFLAQKTRLAYPTLFGPNAKRATSQFVRTTVARRRTVMKIYCRREARSTDRPTDCWAVRDGRNYFSRLLDGPMEAYGNRWRQETAVCWSGRPATEMEARTAGRESTGRPGDRQAVDGPTEAVAKEESEGRRGRAMWNGDRGWSGAWDETIGQTDGGTELTTWLDAVKSDFSGDVVWVSHSARCIARNTQCSSRRHCNMQSMRSPFRPRETQPFADTPNDCLPRPTCFQQTWVPETSPVFLQSLQGPIWSWSLKRLSYFALSFSSKLCYGSAQHRRVPTYEVNCTRRFSFFLTQH